MENTNENILDNGMVIEINQYNKPIGTYIEPLLDIAYFDVKEDRQRVSFHNKEEVMELYDRYKYDITNDWGYSDVISVDDFLETEHILILLGCMDGEGHEVLYS